MGKHKNSRQEKIFIEFMEKNKDIAQNFSKREKHIVESLWKDLANDLNSHGPPQKDVSAWKKVWSDWKTAIRKKLVHNKKETRKTGGGPNNTLPITDVEDTIAILTGIYTIVDGISDTTFGVDTFDIELPVDNEVTIGTELAGNNETCDRLQTQNTGAALRHVPSSITQNNVESSSRDISDRTLGSSAAFSHITPQNRRDARRKDDMSQYFEEQKNIMTDISGKISEVVEVAKENKQSLKRTYRAIEKMCDVMKEKNDEQKRHNLKMESSIIEKNKIKKKC